MSTFTFWKTWIPLCYCHSKLAYSRTCQLLCDNCCEMFLQEIWLKWFFCETVIHMTRSTHWCESQNVKLTTRIFQKTTFWHQQSLYNSYLLDHISRKLTELWCLLCTPATSQTKIIYILQGAQKFFISSIVIHLFAQLNISEAFLINIKWLSIFALTHIFYFDFFLHKSWMIVLFLQYFWKSCKNEFGMTISVFLTTYLSHFSTGDLKIVGLRFLMI